MYVAITYINLIAVCPIKGQIRKECASHPSCARTCNSTDPTICPAVCIINGCECPDGTVIDKDKNECVAPRECEGNNNANYEMKNLKATIHMFKIPVWMIV